MGSSRDYADVPEWVAKPEGYQTGAMVKYKGNVFRAAFWATEPGVGDSDSNGWRLYDELYDQTPHTPTAQAKIIAYIPVWRVKEGFNYTNAEMYQYITHGIVAFLTFSESSLAELDPTPLNDVNAVLPSIVSAGHSNGTKIMIALGGANDYGFLSLMTAIGADSTHPLLARAVERVVNFVHANALDGVDLDLECWWGRPGDKDQGGRAHIDGPHPAGRALTLFASKLKQAMPDKLVSATLFGTSWYGNNYDPQIAEHTDWLGVMTYDMTGSWNNSPVGPHTALHKIRNQADVRAQGSTLVQESFQGEQQGPWPNGGPADNPILSVEDTLWYWTNPAYVNWQGPGQRIPRNKLAAGVPIYGYDFAYAKDPDDLSGEVPPGYKTLRYKEILAAFPGAENAADGNIKVSGSTQRPGFIAAPGNYPFANNVYFETPSTAVSKLNFLRELGAQGVIIWELSNDVWDEHKSIIKQLYRRSGNRPKTNEVRFVGYSHESHKFDRPNFSLTPGAKTFFLIHGWNSGPNRAFEANPALTASLFEAYPGANVVQVNWAEEADVWSYPYVAGQVPYVAHSLAADIFIPLGIDPKNTTIVGHSLGAHIAGFASSDYRDMTHVSIGAVVGLDAAAPFLEMHNGEFNSGLNAGAADRVVAIHSSNSLTGLGSNGQWGLGNYGSIGTLDIYIKWGELDVYGADVRNPNNHDLAIRVYKSLLLGGTYPGVNTWASYYDGLKVRQRAWSAEGFDQVFGLAKLHDSDLSGKYTIDFSSET